MIWPPIRYSYQTVNSNIPHSAPTPPFWLMTKEERCSGYPQGPADPGCTLGNLNWLGTDNQARDVTARIIYGFRISVLFGLALTICSAIVGVTAGAVQGYFGGWTDLLMQRFIEIWSSMPVLYILLIIAAILPPDGTSWSRELAETYAEWTRAHDREDLSRRVSFVPTADEIGRAVAELLTLPEVDALVIAPSGSAAATLEAAVRAGRRVGDDLLVAACVDEPAHALLSPPVTSIDLAARELGSACLELLVEVWDADETLETVRLAAPRLVVRASTAGPLPRS